MYQLTKPYFSCTTGIETDT